MRDFTVVEQNGRVIGCGALHLYGQHLAEVRSIAVARDAQGQGAGSKLVDALLKEARQHQVAQVCLFTRSPEYFGRLGFVEVPHAVLPDKIFKDCRNCPMFTRCDETAMIYAGAAARAEVVECTREIDAVLRPERQPAIATPGQHRPRRIMKLASEILRTAGIRIFLRHRRHQGLGLARPGAGARSARRQCGGHVHHQSRDCRSACSADASTCAEPGGRVRAVVVNSGNANCATGEAGRRACEQVCRSVAKAAGCQQDEVFPASTGIIGVPLPAGQADQRHSAIVRRSRCRCRRRASVSRAPS